MGLKGSIKDNYELLELKCTHFGPLPVQNLHEAPAETKRFTYRKFAFISRNKNLHFSETYQDNFVDSFL
jgi:hypothetical protein